ncbi:MAG: NAD-dependent succinate-semialdehyde dehydrogenase [Methylococcaceae bacterium]|nr:NAD-dependent succinate-semialdehyde dehydrogenase [Methylococcaceae bacterium]
MPFISINPASGEVLKTYQAWDADRLESTLAEIPLAAEHWSCTPMTERATLLSELARLLRESSEALARLICLEMGKRITEARQEVEKCAWTCDYYATHAASHLAEEIVITDAARSYVAYEPLGAILAIMPWNFPFWQVFRAAVPILVAGNTVLLKHAPTVTGCALAIEKLFHDAGFPASIFRTLLIPVEQIPALLADDRIQGVSFTGSVNAGREVARLAGANLKKAVLELGGSDPFIVLEDADLEWTVAQAAASRFLNGGQSCIAAKRFILVDDIADHFVERFVALAEALQAGDPLNEATTLPPLARPDLRETLHAQVGASIAAGAVAVTGCSPLKGQGNFYQASLLDRVLPGMPAFEEELFGPVAAIVRVPDEAEALRLANRTRYGLGGSVWTADIERGERLARRLQCGMSFVNGMVKSDPRLPCGGIKASGFGRELSYHGIREFTNVKALWIRGPMPSSPG